MCGIAGMWTARGFSADALTARARAMADAIAHRGPDDVGAWVDASVGLGLGHRRLSIVDLSPEGHQPMRSVDGRWMIAFNGEIYNYTETRAELEAAGAAPNWRGHSDTEVLLAAITHWGLERALDRTVGMFAIALWDRAERTLHLIRDRAGEKPLYYGYCAGDLLFGSELKSLRAHTEWIPEVDRTALAELVQYSWIPAPRSIYVGVEKLAPGGHLAIDEASFRSRKMPATRRYWTLGATIERARADMLAGDLESISQEVETALRRSIAGQMVADVPVGAFLSGGIDSSTVVALMQAQASRPVRTFSIGFTEAAYNEAPFAAAVAKHLGTDHTELYVTPAEAQAVIPTLADVFDEPFADSSQVPTVLVSRLARAHVTVSLSGDAGDELFGGYSRYLAADTLARRITGLPASIRRLGANAVRAIPRSGWDRMFKMAGPILPSRLRVAAPGHAMHRFATVLGARDEGELYDQVVSTWYGANCVIGARPGRPVDAIPSNTGSAAERMMARDTLLYLPEDILVKVDRAAMSVALETRVPLLDHRLIELAWRVPDIYKMHGGVGKRVLRHILHRHVPAAMVERPKMGFSIPLDQWLRGPLRAWAEALIDPARLRREGYFDPEPITTAWKEHLEGRGNYPYGIWNVLMFQAWLDRHGPSGKLA